MAQTVKHLSIMQETWVRSLGGEDLLEREMATTPVLLPGKSHGWRSLVGYSPWGRKESDTTERLHFTSLRSHLQEDLDVDGPQPPGFCEQGAADRLGLMLARILSLPGEFLIGVTPGAQGLRTFLL